MVENLSSMTTHTNSPRSSLAAVEHLDALEAESIFILREAAAECACPAVLYSVGKDSSVLLRLTQKAFYPGRIPFKFLHIDTGYKFSEMIRFRDNTCEALDLELLVHSNREAIADGASPFLLGTTPCCSLLKTKALLDALSLHAIDAAIGGARRDEEKSRAKERVFSVRGELGQWNPETQRPEPWHLYNTRLRAGQSLRIFPLSNWTELNIWEYIDRENIPVVPLYFAKTREMLVRGDQLLPTEHNPQRLPGETPSNVMCRMRSLGCTYCTGAVRSTATNVQEIIEELKRSRRSEREARVIDHDQDGSMELKKREGYF
jgi:sulfate adenylyltransferase subunit 2